MSDHPAEPRPKLTLEELVRIGTNDGADYCDGDCSGYHETTFEHGVLTLDYIPDVFALNEGTSAQFVEVGMLLTALRIADGDGHDEYTDWRLVLSNLLGVELELNGPEGGTGG